MTAFPSPEFLQLQEAVAGRFSIEREIGRGGMGLVFLARDVQLERHVAIKLLSTSLSADPEMRQRFLREARVAAQCFHPHIVPIHAVEEAGNLAFFVMAYVRGETLAQRVARTGPLPAALVERIAREVGWALAYAHGRGVVHRDIKPENILLEQGTDRSLLTDFGIALQLGPDGIAGEGVAGTAFYMAPEQLLGETIDGRADLYALGVTLYVAATGRHPFDGKTTMMVLASAEPQRAQVADRAPSLAPALADAIDRCLALRAADRFDSAEQFVRTLDSSPSLTVTSSAAAQVSVSARATETIAGWTAAIGVSTWMFVLGEAPRSLGRTIMQSIGVSVTLFLVVATVLRGAEAILAARRAARAGIPDSELSRAIGGDEPQTGLPMRTRVAAASTAAAGALLAYLQGWLGNQFSSLPGFVEGALQIGIIAVPPILIGRGAGIAVSNSRLSAWIRRKVTAPAGRLVSRIVGARREASDAAPDVIAAPTEVLLDRAALSLFNALPVSQRAGLTTLPGAVSALAREADMLRKAEHALTDAERAARAAGHLPDSAEIRDILARKASVDRRLATTIAALENIRLDLLRLAMGSIDASNITTHLEAARHLERRLEAEDELRALLARPLHRGLTTPA